MFGLGKKKGYGSEEFSNGYWAADEFLDLAGELTTEQASVQWDVVEANHSSDYVEGYAQCILDEASKPWYKFW